MSLKETEGQYHSLRIAGTNIDTPCAFTGYRCSQARIEGFDYCIRHILEDKSAPFRQCSYVYSKNSKQCFRAAPISERKEGFCAEHSRHALRKRQKIHHRPKPLDTPEILINQLSHHQVAPSSANHQVAPLSNIQKSLPDLTSVPNVADTILQYNAPIEGVARHMSDVDVRLLPRAEDDSELESAESDGDALDHAGIFTTEEASRIYIEKMQKLKSLYVEESKRLSHFLRENRKEYLQTLKLEKEDMMSIHAQPKGSVSERGAYQELKSLARFHKRFGAEAVMQRLKIQRKAQSADGAPQKVSFPSGCVKCIYSEGSWRCGVKSVPLSKYCFKHIMQDERQVLFRWCGVMEGGGEECEVAIIPLPHAQTCIYHTPIPPLLSVSEGGCPKPGDTSESSKKDVAGSKATKGAGGTVGAPATTARSGPHTRSRDYSTTKT